MQDITQEVIRQRRQQIYGLYMSGMSMQSIAKALKTTFAVVQRDIKMYVEETAIASVQLTRDQARTIQLDKLDFLMEKLAIQVQAGSDKAIRLTLDILKTKAQLLGLSLDSTPEPVKDFPFDFNGYQSNEILEISASSDDGEAIAAKPKNIKELSDEQLKALYFEALQSHT